MWGNGLSEYRISDPSGLFNNCAAGSCEGLGVGVYRGEGLGI